MKSKKNNKSNKTMYLLTVLAIWFFLSLFEILSMIFVWPKPVYWRAWELVSNYEGKDHVYAPFKPRMVYDGLLVGDLLNAANLKPLSSEVRRQVFEVDEYGFRNKVGMWDKGIKAVVIGSSFVAGAAETQQNLVSTMLTEKYKIPTYNAALYIVQDYAEDTRFLEHPPKYIIILGAEGDLISSPYRYTVEKRGIRNETKKWNSHGEWEKNNNQFIFTYEKISQYLNNLSMIRYLVNKVYIEVVNLNRSREEIVRTSKVQVVSYEPSNGMLFFQIEYDNPLLGSEGKTETDIKKAITQLELTRQFLAKKGTTLIIAAMPSKANIESSKYSNVPSEKKALVEFEKQLGKSQIEHIKLFDITHSYMKKRGNHLYYFDDGHWNAKANEIIAKLLAEKINQLEKEDNEDE